MGRQPHERTSVGRQPHERTSVGRQPHERRMGEGEKREGEELNGLCEQTGSGSISYCKIAERIENAFKENGTCPPSHAREAVG